MSLQLLSRKYLSAHIILIIGLGFLVYGIVNAPITDNSALIYQKYDCNRPTADARSTDIYCSDPKLDKSYQSETHYAYKWNDIAVLFIGIGLVDYMYLYNSSKKPSGSHAK